MNNRKTINKLLVTVLFLMLSVLTVSVSASAQEITVTAPSLEAIAANTQAIKLRWESADEVYCYKLYVYDTQAKQYNTLYKGRKTEMTVSGLEPGTEYLFAVRAYMIDSNKVYSSKLVKLRSNTRLDTVTGLTQSENTESSHRISWNAVRGADGYIVYYYNNEKGRYVTVGQTAKTTCKLTKLSSAYAYTYKIKAYRLKEDGGKICSAASQAFNAITLPATVSGFRASSVSTDSYTLNWNVSEGDGGYRIYEYNTKTKKYSTVATVKKVCSLPVSSKAPASSSVYVIRSYAKIDGKTYFSALSDQLTVTTRPNAPTAKIKVDMPGNGALKISWTPVEKADGYLIYASERKNSGFVLKKKVSADTLECTIKGLSTSSTTYIKVKAYVTVNGQMVYSANSKLIGAKA